MNDPDAALDAPDPTGLRAAARALRAAIRAHRGSGGHDLCWYHPDLWAHLPDAPARPEVADWPHFMRGCIRYRASLDAQLPGAARAAKEFCQ